MTLFGTIKNDIKVAMKEKDTVKKNSLKIVKADGNIIKACFDNITQ